jgi:DNA replication protein DnaC
MNDNSPCSPFAPLPIGYEVLGEYEKQCDRNPFSFDDPGCGETYWVRSYLTPRGIIGKERTPCPCYVPYLEADAARKQAEQEQAREAARQAVSAKARQYFGKVDMLLSPEYAGISAKAFTARDPSQTAALSILKGVDKQTSALLYGAAGRGKTYLAMVYARACADNGRPVLAVKSIDLLDRIRQTYDSKSESDSAVIEALKAIDVLVIDDIGTEAPRDWVKEQLYKVIDGRHGKRTTIYTSNLTGEEMRKKLGEAITSRIWGGRICEVRGDDWRVKA